MNNAELTEAIEAQTLQLKRILDAGMERAQRQKEILGTVTRMNGFVRDHGETLAAHQQWMESHDSVHVTRDGDFRTLSNRVWALAGLDAGLALAAIVIQFTPIL